MANPYDADVTDDAGNVRISGAITFTDPANQPSGVPNPITDVVNIAVDTAVGAGYTPLLVQDAAEPGPTFFQAAQNSDGAGNVDSTVGVSPLGTGNAGYTASDIAEDGELTWTTRFGWTHQPRSTAADATKTFVLFDKAGDELIEARAGSTLGFFAATPVAQQNVPLTVPTVQDIIDALVALGLVEQSD